MSKKVVTIGGATCDVFIIHQHTTMLTITDHERGNQAYMLLEEGKKIEIQQLQYATGGGATNSAVAFARLGFHVTALVKTGNDDYTHTIIDFLQKEKVCTDLMVRSAHEQTGVSFVIPTPSGDRIVCAYRGANASMTRKELPMDALRNFDQIYITSLSGSSSALLLPIAQEAQRLGIAVATNPGGSQLAAGADILCQALPYMDILIVNAQEAQLLMASLIESGKVVPSTSGKSSNRERHKNYPVLLRQTVQHNNVCFNIEHFFVELLRAGPRIVVVTNGAEGVYVAQDDTLLFHPSIPVNICNTLGAGDAFGSCFVASLLDNFSIKEALIRGICNAASVISFLDAKQGLLTKQAITDQFDAVAQKKLLQTFALRLGK